MPIGAGPHFACIQEFATIGEYVLTAVTHLISSISLFLEKRMSSDPATGPDPYASPLPGTPPITISQDDKLWAMLAHLAGLAGYLGGVLQYVAPLVIYLVYKDKSPFVAFHALQSLFFQLAVLVAFVLAGIITFVTCGIGAPLMVGIGVGALVYAIIAAIKANQGEWFEYWLVGPWAKRTVGL